MKAQSETVYMATMLAGVEPIVVDEIRTKIGDAQIVEIRRGKVFFRSKHSVVRSSLCELWTTSTSTSADFRWDRTKFI